MTNAVKKAKIFVKKVQEQGIPVSSAYLFGSHARGGSNKHSDIDVCVVSEKFGKDYLKEMVELRKISLKIDSRIEPIAFGINDLQDPFSTLASEITKRGISLTL